MICFIPAESEESQLQVDGADPFDQQHVTLGYYGKDIDDDLAAALDAAAERIALSIDPFVATIVDSGPLGDDTPPAQVLFLDDAPEFVRARMELPPLPDDVKKYPTFTPHLTVGYGLPAANLAEAVGDGAILLDAVAFVRGDDWTVYELGSGLDLDDGYPTAAKFDIDDLLTQADHPDYDDDMGAMDMDDMEPDLDDTYTTEAAQEEGEPLRQALGIDGTMADAQDIPHPHVPSELGPWCKVCGLARVTRDDGVTAVCGPHPLRRKRRHGMTAATFTQAERDTLADKNIALSDGSYPIRNRDDLRRALQSIGRAKHRDKVEAHIRRRAHAIGATNMLPAWINPTTAAVTAALGNPTLHLAPIPGHGWHTPNDITTAYTQPTTQPAVTAAITGKVIGDIQHPRKPDTPGPSRSKRGRKNRRQKCLHGSPATCRSVKWLAVYTALRERRHMTKEKAARIANAMHNKWLRGQPNRPGQRPMIRKTI